MPATTRGRASGFALGLGLGLRLPVFPWELSLVALTDLIMLFGLPAYRQQTLDDRPKANGWQWRGWGDCVRLEGSGHRSESVRVRQRWSCDEGIGGGGGVASGFRGEAVMVIRIYSAVRMCVSAVDFLGGG